MRRVVDLLVDRALADPRVDYTRHGRYPQTPASIRRTKEQALAFLSSALGGPIRYEGRPLDVVHKPMAIKPDELDAFFEQFRTALAECGVAPGLVATLSDALESVRGSILSRNCVG